LAAVGGGYVLCLLFMEDRIGQSMELQHARKGFNSLRPVNSVIVVIVTIDVTSTSL